jgi:protein gp37
MGLEIVGVEIGVASPVRDWHDIQWQLVNGCTRVSEGCEHCTAEITMARWSRGQSFSQLRNDPHDARWTGRVEIVEEALTLPKTWEDPRWVFVCSMADLFHESVPFEFVARALEVMAAFRHHSFGICTKRADRMADFFVTFGPAPDNVMVGVTVEHQKYDDRLIQLTSIKAKTRWVAVEPMLGPVNLKPFLHGGFVQWVTFGPEIGEGRRECNPVWARQLLADCRETGVPFFTKHRIDGETIRERPCVTA